jgi:hypothetical protein
VLQLVDGLGGGRAVVGVAALALVLEGMGVSEVDCYCW